MATRAATKVLTQMKTYAYQWTGLLNTDDGAPVTFAFPVDVSLQVFGTFGAAGSVALEGSNDPALAAANFAALTARGGTTAVALTTTAPRSPNEQVYAYRPRVTAGDGTTSLTAILIAKPIVRN